MTLHIDSSLYAEAISYLETIDSDDRVLIIHHWDMDGSAAAAIVSNILEQERGQPADSVTIPAGRVHTINEDSADRIRDGEFTHLIILDMHVPADRVSELDDLGVDVMVIDHHNFDAIPEDAAFVNPRIEDEDAYIPASKLCNDISREFGLDQDWIAGMGVIQDFAVEGHEDLFERLREEYPMYFPDKLTQHQLAKNCRYGKYASVMNIKPYKDTEECARLAHDALVNAETLKYLEARDEYQQLYQYYQEMYTEIERVVEHFDEEKESHEDKKVVFFQFDSAFHINSSIATRTSLDEEDWAHIVINVHDGRANISARCQSGRLDLGTILQEALPENVDGEAGGHKRAAGASMPGDRLDEFKENVLDLL